MQNMLFISTVDRNTYERLKKEGFQCIEETDNKWTFINNPKMNFSDEETKNLFYTNTLCI